MVTTIFASFRVRLVVAPVRTAIEDQNIRVLADQAPELSVAEIKAIYDSVIAAIEAAMIADRLADHWPKAVLDPEVDEYAERLRRKTLTRDMLADLMKHVVNRTARPLLRALTDAEIPPMTALNRKMIVGGATDEVIRNAKELRAHAAAHKYQIAAASLWPVDDQIEDLRTRLRILMNGLIAEHSPSPKAAAIIWNRLRQELNASAASVDVTNLFHRDPFLLMGEVCDMSDECLVEWGRDA